MRHPFLFKMLWHTGYRKETWGVALKGLKHDIPKKHTFKAIGVPDLPWFPRHKLKAHGGCGWGLPGLHLAKLTLSSSLLLGAVSRLLQSSD